MKVGMICGFFSDSGAHDESEIMELFFRYLMRAGVSLELLPEDHEEVREYDALHLFGLSDQTHTVAKRAQQYNIPTIITPFYWSYNFPIHYSLESLQACRDDGGFPEIEDAPLTQNYYERKMHSDRYRKQKFIIENATVIIVSGRCEKLQILRDFQVSEKRIVELPIGVDLSMGKGTPDLFREKYGDEEFILCVGPLSQKRNQHVLIDVARGMDQKLVLIGDPVEGEEEYARRCVEMTHEKAMILGSEDKEMIRSAFNAAKVFALPSAYELPGISYISAALVGTPVVATNRGTTWDYLRNHAFYCDPEDMLTVFDALTQALQAPPVAELKDILLKNYSWGRTTLNLIKMYQKVAQVATLKRG